MRAVLGPHVHRYALGCDAGGGGTRQLGSLPDHQQILRRQPRILAHHRAKRISLNNNFRTRLPLAARNREIKPSQILHAGNTPPAPAVELPLWPGELSLPRTEFCLPVTEFPSTPIQFPSPRAESRLTPLQFRLTTDQFALTPLELPLTPLELPLTTSEFRLTPAQFR